MQDTATLIRELRARGMTQGEIGRRTRIPQPRLSKWGAGQVPRVADDALRLRELLDNLEAGTLTPPLSKGAESAPSSPASANPANHPASTASTTPSEA